MAGFSALIGQNEVKARLGRALEQLPGHAFLFTGPKGIGRRAFAREFARALLCAAPGPDGGCGTCPSCRCFAEGTHPDYREITLNAKDRTIRTENVRRSLVGDIGMMPQISGRKVYFIRADDLNEQSQNVILKTLEEPPEYAVIILTAYSPQNVLPTVLSRAIPVRFGRYPLAQVEQILESKGFGPGSAGGFFARLADGIPGAALGFLENAELTELRTGMIDMAERLPSARRSELVLEYYAFFEENRDSAADLLRILGAWFRDAAVFLSSGDRDTLVNVDKAGQIARFCRRDGMSAETMLRCVQIIDKAAAALRLNAGFELCICNMLLMLRKEF